MTWIVRNLWLIPALPALAAGLSAVAKQRNRRSAASLAIGSMGLSFLLLSVAFAHVRPIGMAMVETAREVFNFPVDAVWRRVGEAGLDAGPADGSDAGDGLASSGC